MNESLEYRLRAHLWALSQPRNPNFHLEAHLEARNYLRETLQQKGRTVREQSFETTSHGIGVNLIAEPTVDSPSPVILVAHYDTVDDSPGADDNGSAVAVALEVALRCPGVLLLLPDLEEAGLLGSRHYVRNLTQPHQLAVVLESVGYWTTEPQSQKVPDSFSLAFPELHRKLQDREFRGDFLALLHLSSDTEAALALEAVLTEETLRVEIPNGAMIGPTGSSLSDFGRSDHLAFWEKGHPCLMLTDSANFRNPNYHRPSDTVETLDFRRMASLTNRLVDYFSSL